MLKRYAIVSLILVSMLAGCAPVKRESKPLQQADQLPGTITNTDPCATNLHSMIALFYLWYGSHHDLPENLDQLRAIPWDDPVAFTCPVSREPYIYNPSGIVRTSKSVVGGVETQKNERVIVYDPKPSHMGYRWAITVQEPEEDKAMVAKVILLPESFFMWQK